MTAKQRRQSRETPKKTLCIDFDLIAAAAEQSADEQDLRRSKEEIVDWVANLPWPTKTLRSSCDRKRDLCCRTVFCFRTPLREHLPESPHRWQMFFEQAFATDHRTRARSASDFLRRLEEALR